MEILKKFKIFLMLMNQYIHINLDSSNNKMLVFITQVKEAHTRKKGQPSKWLSISDEIRPFLFRS